jgi:hypothetical protein
MRKITKEAIDAFYCHKEFNSSNTKVTIEKGIVNMYLFDNKIAYKNDDGLFISVANYNSRTTRERLNGFLGVSVKMHKKELYLNFIKWDGKFVNTKEYDNRR